MTAIDPRLDAAARAIHRNDLGGEPPLPWGEDCVQDAEYRRWAEEVLQAADAAAPAADSPIVLVTAQFLVDGEQVALRISGERVAPGIVITPAIDPDGRLDTFWDLRHETSGRAFTNYAIADLGVLRRAARELVEPGHDWTCPPEGFTEAMKKTAIEVLRAAYARAQFDEDDPAGIEITGYAHLQTGGPTMWHCDDCGHDHQGPHLANICIGCPCGNTGGATRP